MTKATIALTTTLLLCVAFVASAAYAGDRDDPERDGGVRVGPLGQDFGTGVNPVDHPSLRGTYGYGYQARGKRNKQSQSR